MCVNFGDEILSLDVETAGGTDILRFIAGGGVLKSSLTEEAATGTEELRFITGGGVRNSPLTEETADERRVIAGGGVLNSTPLELPLFCLASGVSRPT
jgi:heptaprenylglyceryl phosphate synthase